MYKTYTYDSATKITTTVSNTETYCVPYYNCIVNTPTIMKGTTDVTKDTTYEIPGTACTASVDDIKVAYVATCATTKMDSECQTYATTDDNRLRCA